MQTVTALIIFNNDTIGGISCDELFQIDDWSDAMKLRLQLTRTLAFLWTHWDLLHLLKCILVKFIY